MAKRKKRTKREQRGVALVAVMIAVALALVIVNEFGTTTNVDIEAAANYRDQMKAHFLARSALNLSELILRIQQRLDNTSTGSGSNASTLTAGGVRLTDFADQMMLAFCGSPEEVQAAVGFNPSLAKGLGADVGTCGIVGRFDTDDKLINVNCFNGKASNVSYAAAMLTWLMYFPAYDLVFNEPDSEGYRRDRDTQLYSIQDYIDVDTMRGSQRGTTEDYGYESLKDPYKAKNTYIDTVGEVRLARGVDDRWWALFGSALTAYGGCKINVGALDNPQIIAGILAFSAKDPNDPMLANPQKLFALANLMAKAHQFGETFSSTNEFAAFALDPQSTVSSIASTQQGTANGSAAGSAMAQGLPGLSSGEKLTLVLDKTKLGQILTATPWRTYRVQAYGEIDRAQKMADGSPVFPPIRSTYTGVWDMKIVPQNSRKTPVPKGAWVFLQED
ncbi:MAG TPA: hypothetical protein VGM88_17730 [Kofleriaceae bacterium]|jgi:general secretion pathway protein K